ncbi:MAG: type II secretion system protein [Verrucomicrobiales bacterium]
MKILSKSNNFRRGGYTLIEALVSSAILLIGIGAAASMSLTMLTQEEINERTVQAMNHLENAASLYRLGIEPADIEALLPQEPAVNSLTFIGKTQAVTGIGTVPTMEITMVFKPASAPTAWGSEKAVSGDSTVTRSHTVEVFRSNQYTNP